MQTALIPFAFMLEVTRAGQNVHYRLNHTKRALGGKRESRHIEGVYFDALFETHRNLANLRYCSLELSNGRCPGCDLYHSLWRILPARTISVRAQGVSIPIYSRYAKAGTIYIHIGVGSDVVCSTTIGSARASMRGTDNRTDSRFFYALLKSKFN